jgi:SPP1 family predicted phage head-tail adaptor
MTARGAIGELRTRLVLESPVRASDGGGGGDIAWETVAEVWAAVRPVSGGEGFALDRVAGHLSHEVVMRHRAGVTPEMRLREGARVYDIRAVLDPDGRRHWLRCLTEARDL